MSSSNPLAYVGINKSEQPNFITAERNPTNNDKLPSGVQWFNKSAGNIYISKNNGIWGKLQASTTGGLQKISDIYPDGSGNFNINAGKGIIITPGSSNITIASKSENIDWTDYATSATVLANSGSISTATISLTLPISPVNSDICKFLVGIGETLIIQASPSQKIRLGKIISNEEGTAQTSIIGSSLNLVYIASQKQWVATSSIGNWTII